MRKYLLLLALLVPVVGSADTLKIGVVDGMRLLNEYGKLTGVDDKLQARFVDPKKELDDMAKEIEAQEKQLKTNEVMLTEAKNKKAKENLGEKYKLWREKTAALSKEMQTAQMQEVSVFRDVILDLTQKLAKDEKYTLIIQKDGVMYFDPSYDVTAKVLTRLKAELPKK